MRDFAINRESADALTELSYQLISQTSNVRYATEQLASEYRGAGSDLGEFEGDAMALMAKAEKAVDDFQDAVGPLPDKLNEIADKIRKILANRMV